MIQTIKKILFVLAVSPVFIWMAIHPKDLAAEWMKMPGYFKENISSLISPDKVMKVDIERWNAFGPAREDFFSKAYYNKGLILIDDFFSLTTYLSPRLYFQSGDGTGFSPSGVEPLATPLFVFWVLGILHLVKKGKYKLFVSVFLFAAFAYLAGHRNFAFLFPVAAVYAYISVSGIESLGKKLPKKAAYTCLVVYGFYLLARMFFLR